MGRALAEFGFVLLFAILVGALWYAWRFDDGERYVPLQEVQQPAVGGRATRAAGKAPAELQSARSTQEKSRLETDREMTLVHQKLQRRYLVHTPEDWNGGRPLPVVLAFHGGMGRAETQRAQSGMNDVADRFGFMVVYPDGTGSNPRLLTFNAGNCCGYAMQRNVDDVDFVRVLIEALARDFPIDRRRIYATGFSNGAMLCHRLGVELSDQIAAIAPVSGDLGIDGPPPSRSVPVIEFHGLLDQNILFEGGVGPNQFQRMPHRSIPATIDFWVAANHCAGKPAETREDDVLIWKRYAPAAGGKGAPVELYVLKKGGHTWPGGADVTAHLNTGPLVVSVDASTLIWRFFEQFALEDGGAPAPTEEP
jgi:polyhydroxybutyrate depolymerase